MKTGPRLILILLTTVSLVSADSPKIIYEKVQNAICLVSFFQNISSDAKIGSYDKIKQYCIGVLVNAEGLVMVTDEVYPVSLDFISGGSSFLSGMPSEFKVKISSGEEFDAAFLGKDDQARVAFIQIDTGKKNRTFPYIRFVSTEKVSVADSIYVAELLAQNYNFSLLFSPLLINAVIESPQRKFLVNNYSPALSPGGLVVNQQGEGVGITISQVFDFTFMQPSDFEDFHKEYLEIAPSEWFVDLINDPPNLSEDRITQNSWLGIRMQALTTELQKYWKIPQEGGIVVNRVFPESPAEKAGLQVGDVLLAINDSTLDMTKDEESAKLRNIILSYPVGAEINVTLFRDNDVKSKMVTLTAAPKAIGLAEGYPVPEWGFEIREITRDILYQDNLPLDTKGVFVFQVDRASPAGIAGLRIGDLIKEINGQQIADLSDAKAVIQNELTDNQPVKMLKVQSNRTTRFVFIDLNK